MDTTDIPESQAWLWRLGILLCIGLICVAYVCAAVEGVFWYLIGNNLATLFILATIGIFTLLQLWHSDQKEIHGPDEPRPLKWRTVEIWIWVILSQLITSQLQWRTGSTVLSEEGQFLMAAPVAVLVGTAMAILIIHKAYRLEG